MSEQLFKATIALVAVIFVLIFCWLIIPPTINNPDIVGAFAAGFVNPYSSGYSTDVVACWLILAAWIFFEARAHGIKHGWVCILIGLFPGVAVGFAGYLLMRLRQLNQRKA